MTVKHFNNPFLSCVPSFEKREDYHTCSFWEENHPLSPFVKPLESFLDETETDSAAFDLYQHTTTCYYDLYNNGGGNEARWLFQSDFVRSANKLFDTVTANALNDSMFKLFSLMDEDAFPIDEKSAFKAVEELMTNVIFALANTDDELRKLLPEPPTAS